MLNGSWRSDEEMRAGQNSWIDALEYHGLILPDDDERLKFNHLLISYMLNSSRYGISDICRQISMMQEDMISYLISIRDHLSIDQKHIIDEVLSTLNCRNQIEHEVLDLNNECQDAINKYISYSFSDNIKETAKNKLNEMLGLFNDEQS